MTDVLHLVLGPEQHGVVRHGTTVANACGHRLLRATSPREVIDLPACDVVHLPFTERLLAPRLDQATLEFERLVQLVQRSGAALSVTLHDVPHADDPLQQRRMRLYRSVIDCARGVVVNSRTELALVQRYTDHVHSLRSILLPVDDVLRTGSVPPADLPARSVAVLGFVFPDRGYEDVIAALPTHATLVAIGRAASGHEDLPKQYAELANGRWQLTGFVPDDQLGAWLDAAAVPVAPNRRVTASASINTWLAHGRRPFVPESAYAREIVAERPGALTLYDPLDTRALAGAVTAAFADPATTRLAAGTLRGPSITDVARDYRVHLDSCAPPRALTIGNHVVVPGNRWDLVPTQLPNDPLVSVVIPYYESQRQLDLVLAGLSVQTHQRLEVIVADDGSRTAPDTGAAGTLAVRVVRQADRGFRAAAARNLGARQARGEVLVFLDGDTVPQRTFVDAISTLVGRCPDVVAVGRRRHADLSGIGVDGVRGWRDGPPLDIHLSEPAWLHEAYKDTDDLLVADRRSYRFMISAVLAVSADLFGEIGGFDERFTDYGGEDWEFAHRAWCAGAVFAHVRDAIAWHDGPDWAERECTERQRAQKNNETAVLAALLPDPHARGAGPWTPFPSVVVLGGPFSDIDVLATVRSAVAAGVDCAFWFEHISGLHAGLALSGPAINLGRPPRDVLRRAWCVANLHAAADLSDLAALAEAAEKIGEISTPAVTLRSTRALSRAQRWQQGDERASASLLFGRQDRAAPRGLERIDLAATLTATAQRVSRS